MILFVIPLKHYQNVTTSFEKVATLLESTLRSVCQQTNPNFKVLIVCNKIPKINFSHPSIEWLQVDFPPPSPLHSANIGMHAVRFDKGSKFISAVSYARDLNPNYIMFVDADDFISNKISSFCMKNPNSNGWYLNSGYVYDNFGKSIYTLDKFHLFCGTSHIQKYSLFKSILKLSKKPSLDEIQSKVNRYYLRRMIGSHKWIVPYRLAQLKPLKKLPFKAAVYNINHFDASYPEDTLEVIGPKLLSEKTSSIPNDIREEFNLP